MDVTDARGEAAAFVGILEERVPLGRAVDEHVFDLVRHVLERAGHVGGERRGLLGLCLLQDCLSRTVIGGLRQRR